MSYSTISNNYAHLWSKYRPAILKLMVDSDNGPQEYKFSNHEFKGINAKEKGGHSFTLTAFQSKSVNDIRTSEVAKGLLMILQRSAKATELMQTSTYEFILDKQFALHIKKEETAVEDPEVEDTNAAEPNQEN